MNDTPPRHRRAYLEIFGQDRLPFDICSVATETRGAKGGKTVTSGYRALAISTTALLIFTAVSSAASDTKLLRQKCIDDCSIETTTCTTRCKTEDCLNACTEPLGSCINKCREMYPRKTQ